MESTWRSRSLFVSSTFTDMHGERDLLRDTVLPRIAEALRPYQETIDAIDLRWGVGSLSRDDEAIRAAQVLRVCLDEIDRSRPLFLLFLGDRYGWTPSQEQIERIRTQHAFVPPIAMPSVTALETLYAAFNEVGAIQPLFYLRRPLPYAELGTRVAGLHSDLHGDRPDLVAAQRLAEFKALLRSRWPDAIREYTAWDSATRSFRFDELEALLMRDLSALLVDGGSRGPRTPRTWQQEEREVVDELEYTEGRAFVGRAEVIAQLDAFVNSDRGPCALCVRGEAGAGKTALISRFVAHLRAQGVFVLFHAAGASARSSLLSNVLGRWNGELGEAVEVDDVSQDGALSLLQMAEIFGKRLAAGGSRRQLIVCIVDALDQLENTDVAARSSWLPRALPPNVRFIATAQPGVHNDSFCAWLGAGVLDLPPFTRTEAEAAVRRRCELRRHLLDARVIAAIVDRAGAGPHRLASENPLWLTNALEEIASLGSDEFSATVHPHSGDADAVNTLLGAVVRDLPPELSALYERVAARTSRLFGERLTAGILELIGVSRFGLREADLAQLLPGISGAPWSTLHFAQIRLYLRAHLLQRSDGHWDFSHVQFRQFIDDRLHRQPEAMLAAHGLLAAHLLALQADDPLKCTEVVHHLLGAGWLAQAADYLTAERTSAEEAGALATVAALAAEQIRRPEDALSSWPLTLLQHLESQLSGGSGDIQANAPEYVALARLLTLWGRPLERALLTRAEPSTHRYLLEALIPRAETILALHRRAVLRRGSGRDHFTLYDRILLLTPVVDLVGLLSEVRLRWGDDRGALEMQNRALELRRLDRNYTQLESIAEDAAKSTDASRLVLGGGEPLYRDYFRLGQLSRSVGNLRDALGHFEKAVTVSIGCSTSSEVANANARVQQAEILLDIGEREAARRQCQQAESILQKSEDPELRALVLCRIYGLLVERLLEAAEIVAVLPKYECAFEQARASKHLRDRDRADFARSLFAVGRAEDAAALLRSRVASAVQRTLADPANPSTLMDAIENVLGMARVALQARHRVMGRQLLEQGLELVHRGASLWPQDLTLRKLHAHTFDLLARSLDADEDWAARIAMWEQSRCVLEALREQTPKSFDVLMPLLDVYFEIFFACGYRRGAARSVYMALFFRLGAELARANFPLSASPERARKFEQALRHAPPFLEELEETCLTLELASELFLFCAVLNEVVHKLLRSKQSSDVHAIQGLFAFVEGWPSLDNIFGGILAGVANASVRAAHPLEPESYLPQVRRLGAYLLFGGSELRAASARRIQDEFLSHLLQATRLHLQAPAFGELTRRQLLEVITALEQALNVVRLGGSVPWRFPYYLGAHRLSDEGEQRTPVGNAGSAQGPVRRFFERMVDRVRKP